MVVMEQVSGAALLSVLSSRCSLPEIVAFFSVKRLDGTCMVWRHGRARGCNGIRPPEKQVSRSQGAALLAFIVQGFPSVWQHR